MKTGKVFFDEFIQRVRQSIKLQDKKALIIAKATMNATHLLGFICWIVGLSCTQLWAQPGNFSFIHYTTDHGLSHDGVNCILKDRDGFMWFGTENGLNRFDGRNFKVYLNDPQDTTSLPQNYIQGITEDAQGRLWVATHGGMCWFDKKMERFHLIKMPEHEDALSNNAGTERMVIDQDGYGWFGGSGFVVRLNLQTFEMQRFTSPDQLLTPPRFTIDKKGRLWATIMTAVYRFDPKTGSFRYYFGNVKGIRHGVDVGNMYVDAAGTLWCGSWGLGQFRYNEALDTFEDYPDWNSISTQILPDEDEHGQPFFWSGGGVDGLFLFYPHNRQIYRMVPNPREPYSHNGFWAKDLYKDQETGIIWIATENGGIEKYDPLTFKFRRELIPIETERGFSQFSFVSSVLPDRLDPSGARYWVSVWGTGLFEWNRQRQTFRFLPPRADQSLNNEVFDLAQGADGQLYIATAFGFTVYDPKTNKSKFFGDFLKYPFVANKVLSVLVDHAGQVWLGANYAGLFRYNPENEQIVKIPFYDVKDISKTTGYIRSLQEDAQHRIWIATHSGLFRYDPASGESKYIRGGQLPDLYACENVFLGKKGKVWAATTIGLIELDTAGNFIRQYGTQNGLKSEHIYGVIEDKNGMLWLATTNLLHRLDPKTGKIEWFDKQDGLFGNNQLDGFNLSDHGEIFIGFQNAFNYFDPTKVPFNHKAPKVALTGLKILNEERPFDPSQAIVLKPKENVVALEFAALNYSQSNKNQYAYRLEGFDQDWNFTDQPLATYTNLDGGTYRLLVKAANNDGVWSVPVPLATLRVVPPFQRTWYFLALLILLSMALVGGILWYRWQQRLHVQTVRDRIARDLHDDVGSTLSSIRFFSEFARAKVANAEVTPILQRINESAATLSESMQDIIWTINSKHDQLDDLVTRMRQFALRLLEVRHIQFKTHIPEHFLPTRLSINQRRNIHLIFKEAVTNAAKYADCSEVELRLHQVKRYLKMIITDNGKGFDIEVVTSGNGLLNMQKRAEEIGGTLKIRSKPGEGTCIELIIRL